MQEGRVRLVIVLDDDFDIVAASSVTHVQEEGGWPTIALLAAGMKLRDIGTRDIEVDEELRVRLLSNVLLKEHATSEAKQAGMISFYDLVGAADDSPHLVFVDQLDAYEFEVTANDLFPILPFRVFGEQMVIQANVDVHLNRMGQLRAQAIEQAQKQSQIAIPGRDGFPPGVQPGDGRISLP